MTARGTALALLAAALLALSPAEGRGACAGRDLFPELRARHPEAMAGIEAAGAAPYGRGLLFRVARPGLPDSHIFGTIHSADPRVAALPSAVERAIANARVVALELKEAGSLADPGLLKEFGLELLGAVLARTDERPERLLGAADFARLQGAVTRRGLPISAARTFKPAILALTLSIPACADEPGEGPVVDALVARLAQERAIPVIGLETIPEQLAVVSSPSPEAGRDLLLAGLALAEHAEDVFETTIARYREGEIGALLAWMRSGLIVPGGPAITTPPAFLDRLVDERNRRMRDRALPHLERGGAFIAVGAAHIPGPNGLARLVADAGFAVEPVEGTERP